jgi:hypothetical protein
MSVNQKVRALERPPRFGNTGRGGAGVGAAGPGRFLFYEDPSTVFFAILDHIYNIG